MKLPGFTGEASLYKSNHCYRSRSIVVSSGPIVPAFSLNQPQIKVSYQPPQPPYGRGFPGTLRITGQNFAPDVNLLLTITNCAEGDFPVGLVFTLQRAALLPESPELPLLLWGEFNKTIPIFCGGDTTVKVQDQAGDVKATGTTSLPC